MHGFHYIGNRLFCEGVALDTLAARFGTPLYVYAQGTLERHFNELHGAMAGVDHLICYSVKSNSNQSILRLLARLGGGFDIVSAGELRRVIAAGGDPGRCAFAGVGKTESEIELGLRRGVYSFNVESQAELERINQIAGRIGRVAPVAARVNPNVAARTHAKITTGTYENKFGIAFESIPDFYARASRLRHVRLRGLQMHIGSQITAVQPFAEAVRKVAPLALHLKQQYDIEFLSLGGGLGIVYDPALQSGSSSWWQTAAAGGILTPRKYAARLLPHLRRLNLRILLEPGRFITGNAGVLLTRIEYVKRTGRKNFLIVDAAMNDLIRPAFYDAYHEIVPVMRRRGSPRACDVVGPICESGDYFCKDRPLPPAQAGDCLALMSAGAYGSVMASNYNSRPLVAEVLIKGKNAALVRERQPVRRIWAGEKIAPWLR